MTYRRFVGGLRTHDVALAHDHLARVHIPPRLLGSPLYPEREVLRRVLWGRAQFQPHAPPLSMLEHGHLSGVGPTVTVIDLLPAANPARVTWFEPVRRVDGIMPGPSTTAVELLRSRSMSSGAGVLERLATWLRATPRDRFGAPLPAQTWETTSTTSPFPFPVIHPAQLGDLEVAWILLADLSKSLPEMMVVAPTATLPNPAPIDGLPFRWADNRYGWGGTYTYNHYIVIPEGAALRLFVELRCPNPAAWLVEAGGLLSGHWRVPGHAGTQAAVSR